MFLFNNKRKQLEKENKRLKELLETEKRYNNILLVKLTQRERYYIGDTFWGTYKNTPREFCITKILLESSDIKLEEIKEHKRHIIYANLVEGDFIYTPYVFEFSIYNLYKTKEELLANL